MSAPISPPPSVGWTPELYCDETSPPPRATPTEWIVLRDGVACLDQADDADDAEPRRLEPDEIVMFLRLTDFGEATLLFAGDGTHVVDPPMPEGASSVCALMGWQADTLSDDVAGVVAALRELGEADGEYRLSYYDFSPPIAWRFDAATQSFAEIGGVQ